MNVSREINIAGKSIKTPVYFPDATKGVVRGITGEDLVRVGVSGVVVNTYHLMSGVGRTVIKDLGGIKTFMNFEGIVATDSGGFQLLSLIYQNKNWGTISERQVVFRRPGGKKMVLTPEKSVGLQMEVGTDIVICLDDCPAVNAEFDEADRSVQRTIEWAKRSKEEYLKRVSQSNHRPLLLAVVQGGNDSSLRQKCAAELTKIGFDGYGFGGWPIRADGELDTQMLKIVADAVPKEAVKFALGVGNPGAIVTGFNLGYDIFDCVLPTRDARHGRLYVYTAEPSKELLENGEFYRFLYPSDEKYVRDNRPVSEWCDCPLCTGYSRGYLRHLFEIKDSLAGRLATMHNLRFYTKLMEILRGE